MMKYGDPKDHKDVILLQKIHRLFDENHFKLCVGHVLV